MTGGNAYLLLILSALVGFVSSSDVCVIDGALETCEYGCCDDECCEEFSTLAIVGAVIGGLLLLASLVCCGVCIYSLCKKGKNRQSRSVQVQPYQNTNSVYVHNNPYGAPHVAPYGAPPPPRGNPPAYNQASAYPSYSNQYNTAYPPGTVSQPPPYSRADKNMDKNTE